MGHFPKNGAGGSTFVVHPRILYDLSIFDEKNTGRLTPRNARVATLAGLLS